MLDNLTTAQEILLFIAAYIVILGIPAFALFWSARATPTMHPQPPPE